MNKYKNFIIFALILASFGVIFGYFHSRSQTSQIPNEKVVRNFKPTLTINNGVTTKSSDASTYVGKTALETTISLTNGQVVTKGTGVNAFVTSINGRAVDTTKHEFWELFVNGLSSKVGAGSYIIKEGDQIEWHINKKSE